MPISFEIHCLVSTNQPCVWFKCTISQPNRCSDISFPRNVARPLRKTPPAFIRSVGLGTDSHELVRFDSSSDIFSYTCQKCRFLIIATKEQVENTKEGELRTLHVRWLWWQRRGLQHPIVRLHQRDPREDAICVHCSVERVLAAGSMSCEMSFDTVALQ